MEGEGIGGNTEAENVTCYLFMRCQMRYRERVEQGQQKDRVKLEKIVKARENKTREFNSTVLTREQKDSQPRWSQSHP